MAHQQQTTTMIVIFVSALVVGIGGLAYTVSLLADRPTFFLFRDCASAPTTTMDYSSEQDDDELYVVLGTAAVVPFRPQEQQQLIRGIVTHDPSLDAISRLDERTNLLLDDRVVAPAAATTMYDIAEDGATSSDVQRFCVVDHHHQYLCWWNGTPNLCWMQTNYCATPRCHYCETKDTTTATATAAATTTSKQDSVAAATRSSSLSNRNSTARHTPAKFLLMSKKDDPILASDLVCAFVGPRHIIS